MDQAKGKVKFPDLPKFYYTAYTDPDVGTAEAISKIIALHATYKAKVFKVEKKVFKS